PGGALASPSTAQRLFGSEVGDRTATQVETRYGCFLPDLTGLASDLPTADLPPHYIRSAPRPGKADRAAARPLHKPTESGECRLKQRIRGGDDGQALRLQLRHFDRRVRAPDGGRRGPHHRADPGLPHRAPQGPGTVRYRAPSRLPARPGSAPWATARRIVRYRLSA